MTDHDSPPRSRVDIQRRLDRLEWKLEDLHEVLSAPPPSMATEREPMDMAAEPSRVDRHDLPTESVPLDSGLDDGAPGPTSMAGMATSDSFAIDVIEHQNRLIVIADLPGCTEGDIDVRWTDEGLEIDADVEGEEQDGTYLVRERPVSWRRTVHLPDTIEHDEDAVASIEFEDGQLTIVLEQGEQPDQHLDI